LKADAQKVVSIISGDKAKTQVYCQIAKISQQVDQAAREKDRKKAEELTSTDLFKISVLLLLKRASTSARYSGPSCFSNSFISRVSSVFSLL
jgi:hypothetical protein